MTLYYETELYHYGVPGMKWGRRKAVQLTSAYAKTGFGKAHMNATKKIVGTTLGAQRKINKAVKNANTPEAQAARKAKIKKAAKIGAAAAATALVAYGATKAVRNRQYNRGLAAYNKMQTAENRYFMNRASEVAKQNREQGVMGTQVMNGRYGRYRANSTPDSWGAEYEANPLPSAKELRRLGRIYRK